MSHDMFSDVVRRSVQVGTTRWYTVPLSILTHSACLVAVLVGPLLATGMLPTPHTPLIADIFLPLPPELPPELPRLDPMPQPEPAVPANANAAPIVAPAGIRPEPPPRLPPIVGGLTLTPIAPTTTIVRPIDPPVVPVRVGGDIRRPEKLRHVDPVYPPIAKAARVEGMVIIEATIATDGNVRDARVIRSMPMLDQAALDAVSQWRYTPTLLNDQRVEVIMSVNVTFSIK